MDCTEYYRAVCQRVPRKGDDDGNHPADFETLTPEEQAALRYWIRHAIIPNSRWEKRTTYGIKHDFEREGFYITNGQMKGAMLLEGHMPRNASDRNWLFRIKHSIRRSSSHYYDAFDTTSRYSLGWFDQDFMKLLLAAGAVLQPI